MQDATFLFTDIEGSTRLWETHPERMRTALARHDDLARASVEQNSGRVVKMTGDGVHAVFGDPAAAIVAALDLQRRVGADPDTHALPLRIRCGLHRGPAEERDGDFFGATVNRAARLMGAAHGGQVLLSRAVVDAVSAALPPEVSFRELGPLRLRDLASPEKACQLLHPALRAEFPALRALEEAPNNLPRAISSFVGRERELVEIGERLETHRLVSIVGMGGIGKTRIAIQAAAEVLDRFRDGAWLVDLAPLTDAWRIEPAIAAALGLREEAGESVGAALQKHLRQRDLLIVLDNAEHLIAAVARIANGLLQNAPGLRLLVTSREPLRLTGEGIYLVGGLAVPTPRTLLEPGGAQRYASVQLFVDRASAAQPDFVLDADNLDDVSAICHRLDGIPLAIELAAARARSMGVDEILRRLKEHFRWLASRDPSASPRQRTMHALIAWSHALLAPEEQDLLAHLATFAGGFDRAAARAVCAGLDPESVDDALADLVDKSLVVAEAASGRFHLLEAVRQFAQELLTGERADAAHARHFAHFLAYAMRAKPHLSGAAQWEWMRRLDADRDNILAAIDWHRHHAGPALDRLRLVNALKMYFMARGLLVIGAHATEEAMDGIDLAASAAGEDAARGAFNLGQYLYYLGRYEAARPWLERSVAWSRAMGNSAALIGSLCRLGVTAVGQGDLDAAQACLDEAMQRSEESGNAGSLAVASSAMAMLRRVQGRFHDAVVLHERVVALLADADNAEANATARSTLAMAQAEAGDMAGAATTLRAALGLVKHEPSVLAVGSALETAAAMLAMRGDARGAARLFGGAQAAAQESGIAHDPADQRFFARALDAARRELGEGAFQAARLGGSAMSFETAIAEALRSVRDLDQDPPGLTSRPR